MNKPCNVRPGHASTIAGAVAALFAASYMPIALANPTGAQVAAGTVSINSPGAGQMQITQGSPNAIVNWNTFSIGSGEAVRISQPSASSALLNRVMGNDPSVIAGRLQANGKVFLVNPAGVIFAPGSSVNVGSMVASTLNISNADFLAGNFHFVGASPAAVSNAGSLTAAAGGTIALLGGTVSNSGTVSAKLGTVALGAGNDITVDFAGDGLTTLKINQGAAHALIGNTGTLAADGGTVVMSAQTADALAGTVINQQGIVRAQSLSERDGHILLDGGTNGVTLAGGTLDASGGAGQTGGRIDVTGYDVALLPGAYVDASGAAGGGTVHFGGGSAGADPSVRNANAIWMAPSASLHADALVDGNGGNVVAYSETASRIYGTLSAKGGPQGGNGGLIETSGHTLDTTGMSIDASAPKGQGGRWLLDPFEVDIVTQIPGVTAESASTQAAAATTTITFGPITGSTFILNTALTGPLSQGTSVTVQTGTDPDLGAGDIVVDAPLVLTTGTLPATLKLSATGSVLVNNTISSSAGPLSLVFDANVGNTSPLSLVSFQGVTVKTNGGSVTLGSGGPSPVLIQNSSIDTAGGDLTVTGTFPINGVAIGYLVTSSSAIFIDASSVSTEAGRFSLAGTALGAFANGVAIEGASALSTTSGALGITGTATAGGGGNDGVFAQGNNTIQTGSGALTISGAGSSNIEGQGIGVFLSTSSASTTSGALSVNGSSSGSSAMGVFLSGGATVGQSSVPQPGLSSSGGTIAVNGSVAQSTQGGFGVEIQNTTISNTTGAIGVTGNVTDTGTGGNFANGVFFSGITLRTGSGDITAAGSVSSNLNISIGLDMHGSSVQSTSGNIKFTGQSVGAAVGGDSVIGLMFENTACGECIQTPPVSLTTGSGTVSLFGSGTGPFVQGVLINNGTTITSTNGGAIDIRGAVSGPAGSSPNLQNDYGVLIANGTISATGTRTTTIGIAGSTTTSDPGVAIGLAVPETEQSEFGLTNPTTGGTGGTVGTGLTTAVGNATTENVTISTTSPGSLVLRAFNDGAASSLAITQATLSSPDGVLAIMPGSVDPSSFAITAQNATPITLLGTGGGLSIDAPTFSSFASIPNIVLGSSTQTGLITVNGQCVSAGSTCTPTRPDFANNNLTLSNPGAGSQGIALTFGISTPGHTLMLLSAGPVTDPGGIQSAGLILAGPGNFTLTDPQNDVGVLAMANAGNVDFSNSHGFVIGPLTSRTFDSAASQSSPMSVTNSTLTGNLVATAATGNIGLGAGTPSATAPNTNLSAGGSIDLVMENGVFVDAGAGTLSAGNAWRIWASTWNGETRGNVQPNTAQPNFYGCLFGAGCSWGGTVPTTGNHYVYVARPTVTVTADGATRVVGAPNPIFTYTTSGLINGDTAAGTLSGSETTTATLTSPAGGYPINPNFTSSVGYIVNEVPGTLTVIPPPPPPPLPPNLNPVAQSGLQTFFGSEEQTFVYENNLQGTNICIGSNQPLFTTTPPGENQDILAVEWKRVRSQPNLNSCMLINAEHGCGDF
ncbi:filamentous hemagglutinin N-terminal domain-containing protein [Paraburkholderia sp. UYCP14C]|uniref:beta strand repeat-containing protein n=1 Tax=Paraburkholderia sp. UYCP14C TaxID=2511130 RepID=UPI00101EBF5C|nr:filamentous hemagglutinin N-terminal domain-containing protein [Paraburkholderia sp. UYCP14C]RZF28406.1 filamentous hemagglutinin N-terminal domain-containing protein [Paraburkholderia sp. UYCP14C]